MQATLTSKSQITLPKSLQQWLGVKQGDKLEFVLEEGGARVQKAVGSSFGSLLGLLPPPAKAHTIEEMNDAIGLAVAEKHKRSLRAPSALATKKAGLKG